MPNQRRQQKQEEESSGIGGVLAVLGGIALGGLAGYWFGTANSESSNNRQQAHRQQARPSSASSFGTSFPSPQLIPEEDPNNRVSSAPKECTICFKSFDHIRNHGGHICSTRCGHLFCHNCIDQCLRRHMNRCPMCNTHITRNELIMIYNY